MTDEQLDAYIGAAFKDLFGGSPGLGGLPGPGRSGRASDAKGFSPIARIYANLHASDNVSRISDIQTQKTPGGQKPNRGSCEQSQPVTAEGYHELDRTSRVT